MKSYIKNSISEGIALRNQLLQDESTIQELEAVGRLVGHALLNGHKVLLCGNGGSAADAQHIAAEFITPDIDAVRIGFSREIKGIKIGNA